MADFAVNAGRSRVDRRSSLLGRVRLLAALGSGVLLVVCARLWIESYWSPGGIRVHYGCATAWVESVRGHMVIFAVWNRGESEPFRVDPTSRSFPPGWVRWMLTDPSILNVGWLFEQP